MEGKRLIVKGDHFDDGAMIVVNDREERTKRDSESPADTLVAKKAGKRLVLGRTATVLVVNPDGKESGYAYLYTEEGLSARYIRPDLLNSQFTSIHMKVGDHLLLDFRTYQTATIVNSIDRDYFSRVMTSPFDTEFYQLYRVERAGSTFILIEVRYPEPGPFIRSMAVVVE